MCRRLTRALPPLKTQSESLGAQFYEQIRLNFHHKVDQFGKVQATPA